MSKSKKSGLPVLVLGAVEAIFGYIGVSPLEAIMKVFHAGNGLGRSEANILGIQFKIQSWSETIS